MPSSAPLQSRFPVQHFQTYIKRVDISFSLRSLQGRHRSGEQLPRLVLELQQVSRPQLLQHVPQRYAIGLEQEELPPEALGFVSIVFVLDGGIVCLAAVSVSRHRDANLERRMVSRDVSEDSAG